MIEWATTPGAIGRPERVFTKRCLGDMLSMAVMVPRSVTTKALGSVLASAVVKFVTLFGRLTKLAIRRRTRSRDAR